MRSTTKKGLYNGVHPGIWLFFLLIPLSIATHSKPYNIQSQSTLHIHDSFVTMNTSEQSQPTETSQATAASTPSPTVITQADAVTMIKLRCQEPNEVNADSNFYYGDKDPQNQSMSALAWIGSLRPKTAMPQIEINRPNTTILYDRSTIVGYHSPSPCHTEIKENYSVKPPEFDDDLEDPAISRLYGTDKGLYSVVYEGDTKLFGTELSRAKNAASEKLGKAHEAFNWTGGDVRYHPFKPTQTLPIR